MLSCRDLRLRKRVGPPVLSQQEPWRQAVAVAQPRSCHPVTPPYGKRFLAPLLGWKRHLPARRGQLSSDCWHFGRRSRPLLGLAEILLTCVTEECCGYLCITRRTCLQLGAELTHHLGWAELRQLPAKTSVLGRSRTEWGRPVGDGLHSTPYCIHVRGLFVHSDSPRRTGQCPLPS
jgi:hypothetical protein